MQDDFVTDYDIQALVDGELPKEKAAQVRMYLSLNQDAMARYQQLERQKQALKNWWSHKKHH